MFCNIDIAKTPEALYPEDTLQALETIREIAEWIAENKQTEDFLDRYGDVVKRFGAIVDQMPKLLAQEELLSLKTKSSAHRLPALPLYNGLRRYLRANPL